MSTAIFLNDNKFLNSQLTLITGTENAQFPLNNLKHDFSTKVFQAVENSVEILIDLEEVSEIDFIALRGSKTNGLLITSASIIGSATTVFTGTPEILNISHKHNFGYLHLTTNSYRYWKLTLNSISPVELSNVYIGKKIQLAGNNIAQGFSYVNFDNSKSTENEFGHKFFNQGSNQKSLAGEIKYCTSLEYDQINEIQSTNGKSKPIWFMLDPNNSMSINDSNYIFSGMFYIDNLRWKNSAPSLWDVNINLEEAM